MKTATKKPQRSEGLAARVSQIRDKQDGCGIIWICGWQICLMNTNSSAHLDVFYLKKVPQNKRGPLYSAINSAVTLGWHGAGRGSGICVYCVLCVLWFLAWFAGSGLLWSRRQDKRWVEVFGLTLFVLLLFLSAICYYVLAVFTFKRSTTAVMPLGDYVFTKKKMPCKYGLIIVWSVK